MIDLGITFYSLGLSSGQVNDFLEFVFSQHLFENDVPQKSWELLAHVHHNIWHSIEFLGGVRSSKAGVVAGTPPADLIFSTLIVLSANILAKMSEDRKLTSYVDTTQIAELRST